MNFLNNILKTFLGNKAEKDISKIRPLVNEINQIQKEFTSIDNDKLRGKTENLKNILNQSRIKIDREIKELENKIQNSENFEINDQLYQKVDSLEEEAYKIIQEKLNNILPEAFAIVKPVSSHTSV